MGVPRPGGLLHRPAQDGGGQEGRARRGKAGCCGCSCGFPAVLLLCWDARARGPTLALAGLVCRAKAGVAVTGARWPVLDADPNYHPQPGSSVSTNMNNQNEINDSSMWPCFGEHLLPSDLLKRWPTAGREYLKSGGRGWAKMWGDPAWAGCPPGAAWVMSALSQP